MTPEIRDLTVFGHSVGRYTVVDEREVRSFENGPNVHLPIEKELRVLGDLPWLGDVQREGTWTGEPETIVRQQLLTGNRSVVGRTVSMDENKILFEVPGVLPRHGRVFDGENGPHTLLTIQRTVAREGMEFRGDIIRPQVASSQPHII